MHFFPEHRRFTTGRPLEETQPVPRRADVSSGVLPSSSPRLTGRRRAMAQAIVKVPAASCSPIIHQIDSRIAHPKPMPAVLSTTPIGELASSHLMTGTIDGQS